MSWNDCQHLDPASWCGKPPALRNIDIPLYRAKAHYPGTFSSSFNSSGEDAIRKAVTDKLIPSPEPHYVSPFLFFCEGIHPWAVSQYFFLKPAEAQTLFYYYFSSANLDYMALPDALRLLLSRVAYPEDQSQLFALFNAFADAYCEANQYISETREEICKLAIASVVLSMSKRKASSDCIPQAVFMHLIEAVRCSNDYKVYLYESLREKPIVLFFTTMQFTMDPEMLKKGVLTRPGGFLSKKKKLYCVLSNDGVKIYKDQNCTVLSEEVPLHNVTARVVPAKDREPAKLVIASKDGLPFGSSFTKGTRRPAKNAQYEFSHTNEMELKSWTDNMNFVGFYLNLVQLTNTSAANYVGKAI
jgi:hypothetical protein